MHPPVRLLAASLLQSWKQWRTRVFFVLALCALALFPVICRIVYGACSPGGHWGIFIFRGITPLMGVWRPSCHHQIVVSSDVVNYDFEDQIPWDPQALKAWQPCLQFCIMIPMDMYGKY